MLALREPLYEGLIAWDYVEAYNTSALVPIPTTIQWYLIHQVVYIIYSVTIVVYACSRAKPNCLNLLGIHNVGGNDLFSFNGS